MAIFLSRRKFFQGDNLLAQLKCMFYLEPLLVPDLLPTRPKRFLLPIFRGRRLSQRASSAGQMRGRFQALSSEAAGKNGAAARTEQAGRVPGRGGEQFDADAEADPAGNIELACSNAACSEPKGVLLVLSAGYAVIAGGTYKIMSRRRA